MASTTSQPRTLPALLRRLVLGCLAALGVLFGAIVPASASATYAYDAPASAYDAAVHTVHAHTSVAVLVASPPVREDLKGTVATVTGPLSVALRLSVAANTAGGLSDDLTRLANQHVTGSGDTVLGRYPGYISKANSKGASYFDIGDDWNTLVARGQDPWVLNQHFLDGRIAAGDRILLSVPRGDIVPGTYLAREVQYLTSNGYQWTNQWSLRPGG